MSSETFETLRSVSTTSGTTAYRRAGSGPTLVLLHALALSSAIWQPLARRLAGSFDVVAPDARGHGATSWDGEPFTMADLATDVVALLDALAIDLASVAGMSMGGSTAMVLGPLLGERLTGLVLLDTTAWYGPHARDTWAVRAAKAADEPRSAQV